MKIKFTPVKVKTFALHNIQIVLSYSPVVLMDPEQRVESKNFVVNWYKQYRKVYLALVSCR